MPFGLPLRFATLPQYLKDHCVYYAGPAKTPEGYASGSFGPTTAGRMDAYVDAFQKAGGSMVMLAKGNRSKAVTKACKKHGGVQVSIVRPSLGLPCISMQRPPPLQPVTLLELKGSVCCSADAFAGVAHRLHIEADADPVGACLLHHRVREPAHIQHDLSMLHRAVMAALP